MGLFLCNECKRDNISKSLNSTNYSSNIFSSSSKIMHKYKKSKTFSERENNTNLKLKKKNTLKVSCSQKRTNSNPIKRLKQFKVKLEDFNFIRLIGIGSFGKVYVASKNLNINKLYAIKILNKDKINNSIQKKSINTERILLAKLNHPFVMKLNYAFQTKK